MFVRASVFCVWCVLCPEALRTELCECIVHVCVCTRGTGFSFLKSERLVGVQTKKIT